MLRLLPFSCQMLPEDSLVLGKPAHSELSVRVDTRATLAVRLGLSLAAGGSFHPAHTLLCAPCSVLQGRSSRWGEGATARRAHSPECAARPAGFRLFSLTGAPRSLLTAPASLSSPGPAVSSPGPAPRPTSEHRQAPRTPCGCRRCSWLGADSSPSFPRLPRTVTGGSGPLPTEVDI